MSQVMRDVRHDWVYRFDSADAKHCAISYAHMCTLEHFIHRGEAVIAAAFQCSGAGAEGGDSQHLRFATSRDGGEHWTDAKCVMWGLNALWSPILHYHADADAVNGGGKLCLFYTESRKARSPGGDVKCIRSTDAGETWSPDVQTVYTHEADGGVPKVLANKLVVVRDDAEPSGEGGAEEWLLPFWREPVDSWIEYGHYHPLQENPQGREPRPPAAPQSLATPPESREGSAGVLASRDAGASWEARGHVRDRATWLIENTLCDVVVRHPGGGGGDDDSATAATSSSLVMLFRTGTGRAYRCDSSDRGRSWTRATPTTLPNPNSKVGMTSTPICPRPRTGGAVPGVKAVATRLILAYNPSETRRAPLHLATSDDGGDTWTDVAVVESDPEGNFAYPTPIAIREKGGSVEVKVGYSVWGQGIRMATIRL